MTKYEIQGEVIQLNQLLKFLGWVESGSQANECISEGLVTVNGQIELRKRNKILNGFVIEFDGQKVQIVAKIPIQTD
jgi:ribosome-associated protein